MSLLRAVAVHKHRSGLPRDSIVNTFHFDVPDPSAAVAEQVAERVRDFYTAEHSGQPAPMMAFGDQVGDGSHEVRVYEIDIETNRTEPFEGAPPVWIESFDHVGRGAGNRTGLPSEVALCLSFRSTDAPTVPPARKRGRIYFGPVASAYYAEDAGQTPRPSQTLRDMLLAAGSALRAQSNAAATWVIYSRPYEGRGVIERPNRPPLPAIPARGGSLYDVTTLFIDDAFDTQRRRGERANVRTTS